MGFIKDLFKIEERRMWNEIMAQLPQSCLDGITEREFLRPSTPEMKDKVELAKRCCKYVTSLPQNDVFLKSFNSYLSTDIGELYIFVKERLPHWDEMAKDFDAIAASCIDKISSSSMPKTEEEYLMISTIDTLTIEEEWNNYVTKQQKAQHLSDLQARIEKAKAREWAAMEREIANNLSSSNHHISEMQDLGNHSVHSTRTAMALGWENDELEEKQRQQLIQQQAERMRQQREKFGYSFNPSSQNSHNQQGYDDSHTSGRGR